MNIQFINDDSSLQALVDSLKKTPLWSFDTEFMRVDTFFAKLALLQIGVGEQQYLIDPLKFTSLKALKDVFTHEEGERIVHACSEDIEVLTEVFGTKPTHIRDTQIATAFLGQGLQVGYQKALLDNLNVSIPKDVSRSDWLQRPLDDEQISYAALDVKYLVDLYSFLQNELHKKNLFDFFISDCQLMMDELIFVKEPTSLYKSVSNAWQLSSQQLAVLQALLCWREEKARTKNTPRSFLIKNPSLIPLAKKQPHDLRELSLIDELTPRILRKEGDSILAIIKAAQLTDASTWPQRLPVPLPREARSLFDELKAAVETVSQYIQVPVEVLWRKRFSEEFVFYFVNQEEELPRFIQGWRYEVLWPVLLPIMLKAEPTLKSWRELRAQSM